MRYKTYFSQPSVIMKPNLSMCQESIVNSEAVSTTVKARATRIFDRLVTFDDEGVIELQEFVGN